jgi:hypothetical protein
MLQKKLLFVLYSLQDEAVRGELFSAMGRFVSMLQLLANEYKDFPIDDELQEKFIKEVVQDFLGRRSLACTHQIFDLHQMFPEDVAKINTKSYNEDDLIGKMIMLHDRLLDLVQEIYNVYAQLVPKDAKRCIPYDNTAADLLEETIEQLVQKFLKVYQMALNKDSAPINAMKHCRILRQFLESLVLKTTEFFHNCSPFDPMACVNFLTMLDTL